MLSMSRVLEDIGDIGKRVYKKVVSCGYSVTSFHLWQFTLLVANKRQVEWSVQELAAYFLLSPASMRRVIRRAEDLDLIIVEEQWGPAGFAKPNRYKLHPSLQAEAQEVEVVAEREQTPLTPAASSDEANLLEEDWFKPHFEQLRIEGWEPERIAKLVQAYKLGEKEWASIVIKVRTDAAYCYPDVFNRSIPAGKPVPHSNDVDAETRAKFIRHLTETACQRRSVPVMQRLKMVYSRLAAANLAGYATEQELDAWRKSRRIVGKAKK